MINGYIKPQLKIRQLLERIPDVPQVILSTFVLGPRYSLHRYTDATERLALDGETFLYNTQEEDESRQVLAYEDIETDAEVVTSSVKVYGEALEAHVADIASASDAYGVRLKGANPNKLEVYTTVAGTFTTPVNVGELGSSLMPELGGRPLQVGDTLYLANDASGTDRKVRRSVIGFERALTAASFGTNDDKDDSTADNAFTNVKTTAATFTAISKPVGVPTDLSMQVASDLWSGNLTGQAYGVSNGLVYGDTYTLTCTSAGVASASRWRVRTASGKASADNVSPVQSGTTIYFAHPVFGGLVLTGTVSSAGFEFAVNSKYAFQVEGDFTILDTDHVTPASRDLNLEVSGSEYTGSKDTTYVLTVIEGTDFRAFDPMQIVEVLNGGTQVRVAADATQDTGAYHSHGYIPGLYYGTTYSFKRNAAGLVTICTAATGVPVVVEVATSAWVGKTLYLTENPSETNYAAEHPNNDASKNPVEGAVLRITDTNGVDVATEVELSGAGDGTNNVFAIGTNGLKAQFTTGVSYSGLAQAGLRKGDVYYVHAKAAANTGEMNTIILSGRAAETETWDSTMLATEVFDVEARAVYAGELPVHSNLPGDQYEVESDGVYVRNTARVYVSGFTNAADSWRVLKGQETVDGVLPLSFRGKLFVSYKAFQPAAAGTQITLTGVVPDDAGTIDIENPYAYGLSRAISGAQGRPVYAAPISTDDMAGYTALLRQAQNIEGIYAIAPMTTDRAIQTAVKDHCEAMSTETKKLWRRCYVGTESPGSYSKLSTDADGDTVLATILSHEDGNIRVVSANGNFLANDIQPNDILRVNFSTNLWGEQEYDTYVVNAVLDDTELLLASGPDVQITPATKIEVWAPDTATSQATYVAAVSKALGSRRCVNVWCENPTIVTLAGALKTCPVMYAAAEIAGLRSALFPQQGLTRTEVLTFASAASMYTRYTDDELDIAARDGTLVVTQEKPGGAIFIRHQLTTNASNGILYYEDSIGTNIDEICYSLKSVLEPYIGKRNATPEVVQEIRAQMRAVLTARLVAPPGQALVGPALIGFSNLVVQIDRYSADTINSMVNLTIATPLNVLDVTVNATTYKGEAEISVEIAA